MNSPVDGIVLQAIEFWSTVCDEEQDLAIEAMEAININCFIILWIIACIYRLQRLDVLLVKLAITMFVVLFTF